MEDTVSIRKKFLQSWKDLRKIVIKKIPRQKGGVELYVKTVLVMSIWLIPFICFLIFNLGNTASIILGIICGSGMAFTGMCVMHDASHGTFSKNKRINYLFSLIIVPLAGNAFNWKKQHVEIHHHHTNIDGHDDDLDTKGLFRFTKEQAKKWWHKAQAFYAVPAYSLMTLMWATTKDWFQMYRYFKQDKDIPKTEKRKQWFYLVLNKIFYYSLWVGLPLILGISWKLVLLFFLSKHLMGGLLLTLTFQLAHVVLKAQSFESGHTQEDKLIHQLVTSCNFATKNKLVTYFTGGLNHQKEHHVFPQVVHTQYSKISDDIRDFCEKNNILYTEYKTLYGAIRAHLGYLHQLGNSIA